MLTGKDLHAPDCVPPLRFAGVAAFCSSSSVAFLFGQEEAPGETPGGGALRKANHAGQSSAWHGRAAICAAIDDPWLVLSHVAVQELQPDNTSAEHTNEARSTSVEIQKAARLFISSSGLEQTHP